MKNAILTLSLFAIFGGLSLPAEARDACAMSGKPFVVTGGKLAGKEPGVVKGARAYEMPGGKVCVGGKTYKRTEVRAKFDSNATSIDCQAQLSSSTKSDSGSNLGHGC